MAYTEFLVDDPRTQTKWDKAMSMPYLQPRPLTQFMGAEGSGMPIIVKRQLQGAPGNKIVMQQAQALSNVGIGNNGDIEGSEESGVINNMEVTIAERGNGVRAQAKMSLKYTSTNKAAFLSLNNKLLRDWGLEQWERDMTWCLCGLGNQNTYVGEGSSSIETVNEKAPSTGRIFYGGQTAAGAIEEVDTLADIDSTTNNLFGIAWIHYIHSKLQLMTRGIKPVEFAGGRFLWPWFIHPLQAYQLRLDSGFKNYANSAKDLKMNPQTGLMNFGTPGLKPMERPVAGAMAVIDDFVIIPWQRCEDRVAEEVFSEAAVNVDAGVVADTSRIARSMILGQEAAFWAVGQPWQLYLKDFDYGRKPGIATDSLYGVAKGCYRHPVSGTYGEDTGVVIVDTLVNG